MKHIKIILLLLAIFGSSHLYAQLQSQARIDSLLHELPKAKEDTNKAILLRHISLTYAYITPQEGLKYGQQELELATKLGWKKGIASANFDLGTNFLHNNSDYPKALEYYSKSLKGFEEIASKNGVSSLLNAIGNVYQVKSDYLKAIEYYHRGLKLYEEQGDIHGVAAATCNIGNIYYSRGDFAKALEYYFKAQRIDEEQGYKNYSALVYCNIATIYAKQSDRSKALDYYQKAVKLNEEMGNKYGLTRCIGNMGNIYEDMGNYPKALEHFFKALKMGQEVGDDDVVTTIIANIGVVYKAQKNYELAMDYFESSLKVAEKIGQKEMVATNLGYIGDLFLAIIVDTSSKALTGSSEVNNARELLTGTYKPNVVLPVGRASLLRGAFDYLQRALALAKEINVPEDMLNCYKGLAKAYELSGDYKKSLEMTANWHAIQDSVYSKENREKITRIEDARRQFADSLKAADLQKAADVKAAHRRNYELIGGGILVLALGVIFLLRKNNKLLDKEKQQSETLLHNILPEEVAAQLKDTGKSAARQFDNVSVMFTDFVNFTEASERMKPDALIEELDTCFKAFDEITTKYNIEKIKTIGDAYLAVCGLPTADPLHAENVIKAAKDINAYMADRLSKMGSERTFAVRIGIHSGSVVAGIVGVKKFAYDIWGDTVNTAARMEQNSEAGKINISQTTYELVKDKFSCEYRGEVEAKGKGVMKMYFVG